MNEGIGTLVRLSDAGLTVADPGQDVRGLEVRDRTGEVIGKVDDLLIDSEHRVHFLRVEHGGILGFGATPSFVPVEAIDRVDDGVVHLDPTRDTVQGAPPYDPALTEDWDYYGQLYGYYGYPPFWVPSARWGNRGPEAPAARRPPDRDTVDP